MLLIVAICTAMCAVVETGAAAIGAWRYPVGWHRIAHIVVGGATFGASKLLTQKPTGTSASGEPQAVCSDEAVFVVWNDSRDGNEDIYGITATFDQ